MLKFISFALQNQSGELLPQGGTMNEYKSTAIKGAVIAVILWLLMMVEGESAVKAAAIFMVIVALLTLRTTWKIIYSLVGVMGTILSVIGHGLGSLGDTVIGWTTKRHGRLIVQQHKNSPRISVRSESMEETEELDVPKFLRQEDDNAGFGIFEPQPAS